MTRLHIGIIVLIEYCVPFAAKSQFLFIKSSTDLQVCFCSNLNIYTFIAGLSCVELEFSSLMTITNNPITSVKGHLRREQNGMLQHLSLQFMPIPLVASNFPLSLQWSLRCMRTMFPLSKHLPFNVMIARGLHMDI